MSKSKPARLTKLAGSIHAFIEQLGHDCCQCNGSTDCEYCQSLDKLVEAAEILICMRPEPLYYLSDLEAGDVVRHKQSGLAYNVTAVQPTPIATRTIAMHNAADWEVFRRKIR